MSTQNILGIIRPIADSELEIMLAWRNAPNVRANMYTQHEISLAEHLAWWSRTKNNPSQLYFMYEYQGQPAAIAAFNGVDKRNKCSAWAFYAAPDAPRGSGSRLEYLMLDYAFNNLGLHKLYCEVLDFNSAVIKMHQKFGFITEGIFRQQHWQGDKFIDIHRLAIMADEWQKKRAAMLDRITRHEKS